MDCGDEARITRVGLRRPGGNTAAGGTPRKHSTLRRGDPLQPVPIHDRGEAKEALGTLPGVTRVAGAELLPAGLWGRGQWIT